MKIGFDSKMVFCNHCSLGKYGRSTVELLADHYPNHRYYLYSGFYNNSAEFTIPQGVDIVTPSTFIGDIIPSFWRNLNMSHDIRKKKLDIYHGLNNELPYDVRVGGAKSVVTIHDLIHLHYPNLYSVIDRFIYDKKVRFSAQYSDMIIATSQQTKNDIIEFLNVPEERITVVQQSCDPIFSTMQSSEFKEQVQAKYSLPQEYILSVGTIEERKNLMLTLHAMAYGKIDIDLVVCGSYTQYTDKILEFAAEHKIDKRVHLIYRASPREMAAIYQMARVSVYTSLIEGFGLPILESLHSRTPVITSKNDVFKEVGGDACFYVGQYDLEEMIEALKSVIYDESIRAEMIVKGLIMASKITTQSVAKNLMNVYERIL